MWKTFCHFYRANSIKTNSLTCNLWAKWFVSYKSVNLFWLNYFWHWMWKTFCYYDRANSNLKIDIFDIGYEKHSRRNAFRCKQDPWCQLSTLSHRLNRKSAVLWNFRENSKYAPIKWCGFFLLFLQVGTKTVVSINYFILYNCTI